MILHYHGVIRALLAASCLLVLSACHKSDGAGTDAPIAVSTLTVDERSVPLNSKLSDAPRGPRKSRFVHASPGSSRNASTRKEHLCAPARPCSRSSGRHLKSRSRRRARPPTRRRPQGPGATRIGARRRTAQERRGQSARRRRSGDGLRVGGRCTRCRAGARARSGTQSLLYIGDRTDRRRHRAGAAFGRQPGHREYRQQSADDGVADRSDLGTLRAVGSRARQAAQRRRQ